MQSLINHPKQLAAAKNKKPKETPTNEDSLNQLTLDASKVAAKFPCFDLNRQVNAHSDHASGGGYLNSKLSN